MPNVRVDGTNYSLTLLSERDYRQVDEMITKATWAYAGYANVQDNKAITDQLDRCTAAARYWGIFWGVCECLEMFVAQQPHEVRQYVRACYCAEHAAR